MPKANQTTTTYTKFDSKNLTFTELESNDRSMGQFIGYPRYRDSSGEDTMLLLQTPKMKLFSGGVPRLGDIFKTDADRRFITVPFDLEDPEQKTLYDKLVHIDNQYGTVEKKKELFNKKGPKYHYYPIVRHPEADDDGNQRPPNIKLKVDINWETEEVKTEVWRVTGEKKDKKREQVPIKTIDDLATNVPYMSLNRFIIRPFKIWAHKKPAGGQLGYGIALKAIKIETEHKPNKSLLSTVVNQDAFIDSDDDDDGDDNDNDDDDDNGNDNTNNQPGDDNDDDSDSESSDSDDN